jgi:hypothetical protein
MSEQALRQVVERARVEAAAGAPGPMVAIYVEAEAEHLMAGHDGDEANCDACRRLATSGRR